MSDIDQGDGYAFPEENFWDDRTTPHYSSAHSAQRVSLPLRETDASDLNPDRTMTPEGREYRERMGRAIGAALRQCGIRVQYALAGPSELWDVADLVIRSMPSTRGIPSRETECGALSEDGRGLTDRCEFPAGHRGRHAWWNMQSRETVAPTEEQIAKTIAQHHWYMQYDSEHNDTGGVDCSCGGWSAPYNGKLRPLDAWAAHQARAVLALFPGDSREAVEAKALRDAAGAMPGTLRSTLWLRDRADRIETHHD